jgi:hypothetical protein
MTMSGLYVDPTAAGLGLQMVLGVFVGGLVAVRLFWDRLFSVFRRKHPDEDKAVLATKATEVAEGERQRP